MNVKLCLRLLAVLGIFLLPVACITSNSILDTIISYVGTATNESYFKGDVNMFVVEIGKYLYNIKVITWLGYGTSWLGCWLTIILLHGNKQQL